VVELEGFRKIRNVINAIALVATSAPANAPRIHVLRAVRGEPFCETEAPEKVGFAFFGWLPFEIDPSLAAVASNPSTDGGIREPLETLCDESGKLPSG